MELIANGDLDMKNLNKLKKEQLNQILLTIGLEKGEISRFFVFSNVIYYIEIYIRFPSNLARCDKGRNSKFELKKHMRNNT